MPAVAVRAATVFPGGRATRMLPRRDAISGRPLGATGGGEIETMDEKLELLSKVPLLAGLDRHALEEVGRLADEVDLPAGRVAARQGTSGDEFFLILDGTVRIERDGQLLRDLGPGDYFGELALLGHTGRTATATCVDGLPADGRRSSRVPPAADPVPDHPGRGPQDRRHADLAPRGARARRRFHGAELSRRRP